ncbi:MAG: toll/interleukin-1 receptor domain-containing protein [Ruminococcus sp.]|nr:toll/interleukin-1 receptor domain-containing protein [Ruminococcus sp.]
MRKIDLEEIREPFFFVSYSHDNESDVKLILRPLEIMGYRFWYDDKDIGSGEPWIDEVLGAMDRSAAIVAFISESYERSDPCKREMYYYTKRFPEKKVIPVIIQNGYEPEGWLDFLTGINQMTLPDKEKHLRKLERVLADLGCKGEVPESCREIARALTGYRFAWIESSRRYARLWTDAEEELFRARRREGASVSDLAKMVGRSENSVKTRLDKLGIPADES